MNLFMAAVLMLPLMFAQMLGVSHRLIPSASYTLPFTDSFAGAGAMSSAWTQTTTPGFVSMVRSSGSVTSASAGNSLALETGTGVATTQSIQAAFNSGGSSQSNLVLHGDVGRQNGYQWTVSPGSGAVYAYNAGTFTQIGTTSGTVLSPTSGDVLKFSVSGTTLTCQNITHAGTNTFTVPGANVVTSGYAGLLIDTSSNPQSFGPATVY